MSVICQMTDISMVEIGNMAAIRNCPGLPENGGYPEDCGYPGVKVRVLPPLKYGIFQFML